MTAAEALKRAQEAKKLEDEVEDLINSACRRGERKVFIEDPIPLSLITKLREAGYKVVSGAGKMTQPGDISSMIWGILVSW